MRGERPQHCGLLRSTDCFFFFLFFLLFLHSPFSQLPAVLQPSGRSSCEKMYSRGGRDGHIFTRFKVSNGMSGTRGSPINLTADSVRQEERIPIDELRARVRHDVINIRPGLHIIITGLDRPRVMRINREQAGLVGVCATIRGQPWFPWQFVTPDRVFRLVYSYFFTLNPENSVAYTLRRDDASDSDDNIDLENNGNTDRRQTLEREALPFDVFVAGIKAWPGPRLSVANAVDPVALEAPPATADAVFLRTNLDARTRVRGTYTPRSLYDISMFRRGQDAGSRSAYTQLPFNPRENVYWLRQGR